MGLGLQSFIEKRKTHILTLSFDDGFKKSFYKIAEIHEEYGLRACLNVIAMGHEKGYVKDEFIHEDLLGNFDDWNKIKSRGHEIMPHSWAHKNLTEIPKVLENSKSAKTPATVPCSERSHGRDRKSPATVCHGSRPAPPACQRHR